MSDIVERMRAAFVDLAELSRDGDIDGGEFQAVMLTHDLMVEKPADQTFRALYGGETMFVLELDE